MFWVYHLRDYACMNGARRFLGYVSLCSGPMTVESVASLGLCTFLDNILCIMSMCPLSCDVMRSYVFGSIVQYIKWRELTPADHLRQKGITFGIL